MKKSLLFSFIIILLLGCNYTNKEEKNEIHDGDEYVDLIGEFKRAELEKHIFLKDSFKLNYNNYKVDQIIIDNIKRLLKRDVSVKIIMGTWCDDSRLLVPQFLKVMDKIKFNKRKITFIGLDTEKKSPNKHHEIYEIINVPTFIFYRKEKEINRIVEITIESLEKDILKILRNAGYENAYYGF